MLWEKDSPVILYGSAYLGSLFFNYLHDISNVIAFLDKRADEIITHKGCPVYSPENAPFGQDEKNRIVVIVCVKNVFEHRAIAHDLLSQGFFNIITYESSLFEGITNRTLSLPVEVPVYQMVARFNWHDAAFIKDDGRSLVALIPAPLIFTNKSTPESFDRWSDWPIQALYPHFDLFSIYNGVAESDPTPYIEEYCIDGAKKMGNMVTSPRWKNNILQSRQSTFYNMDRQWQLKTSFFYDNAPSAEFNHGKFNLTSGKHRAAFLVTKGEAFIPLKITQEDYARFVNKESANDVMRYYEDRMQEETFLSVLHPFFYDFPSQTGYALYIILQQLNRHIGRTLLFAGKTIPEISVFSFTEKYVAFTRYFSQIGCRVYNQMPQTKIDNILLDKLSFCTKYLNEKDNYYDIAILELESADHDWTPDIDSDMYLLFVHDLDQLENNYPTSEYDLTRLHCFFDNGHDLWAILAVKICGKGFTNDIL